jgi:hypothetical protein
MFVINLHTKFHTSICKGSLAIVVNLKAKESLARLSHVGSALHKISTKVAIYFSVSTITHHYRVASVAPTLHVHESATA